MSEPNASDALTIALKDAPIGSYLRADFCGRSAVPFLRDDEAGFTRLHDGVYLPLDLFRDGSTCRVVSEAEANAAAKVEMQSLLEMRGLSRIGRTPMAVPIIQIAPEAGTGEPDADEDGPSP